MSYFRPLFVTSPTTSELERKKKPHLWSHTVVRPPRGRQSRKLRGHKYGFSCEWSNSSCCAGNFDCSTTSHASKTEIDPAAFEFNLNDSDTPALPKVTQLFSLCTVPRKTPMEEREAAMDSFRDALSIKAGNNLNPPASESLGTLISKSRPGPVLITTHSQSLCVEFRTTPSAVT